MASLAFGLAGAAGGSFLGIGPNAGFLIGSVIGRILFPPDPIETSGPRLGDLSVSASVYGKAIPVGYGTIRMPGNMIWSSGIREQENREEVGGGKGSALSGPEQTQVTYTYFSSFAMAFAEGLAEDVLRIWANNELIYDRSTGASVRQAGLKFRFYSGNETQVPDSIIEADKGAGQVPAHRGLVYIVFDDFALTNFGNRLPNITAEIAFKTQGANTVRFSDDLEVSEGGIFNSIDTDTLAIDRKRRRLYTRDSTDAVQGLRVYNYDTLNEIRQIDETDMLTSGEIDAHFAVGFDTGNIYLRAGIGNSAPIARIDPDTLLETGRTVNITGNVVHIVEATVIGSLGTKDHFLVVTTVFGFDYRINIINADTMVLLSADFEASQISGEIIGLNLGKAELGTRELWLSTSNDGDVAISVFKMVISGNAGIPIGGGLTGVTLTSAGSIPASTWSTDADLTSEKPHVYDVTDDALIFVVGISGVRSQVFKWSEANGIVWNVIVDSQEPVRQQVLSMTTRLTDGLFGFVDSAGRASMLQTEDGTIVVDGFDGSTLNGSYNPSGQGFFDPDTQSVVNLKGSGGSVTGFVQQLFLNQITGLGDSLQNVVRDISARVGLDPLADLDTTDLAADTVRGYAITRQTSARQAMEPLGISFVFDGVESDGQIKFIKRGNDPIRTITEAELAVLNRETGDVLTEERAQEVELPERLSISYMDFNAEYEQGTQSAKRILNPSPTMRSRNEQALAFPIVFTAAEAAQIAERVLYTAWNERVTRNWRASWQQADLDPTDVVTISMDSGVTLDVRVTEATVNQDLSVSFKGLQEDKVTVVSSAVAQGALGLPQRLPPGPEDTRLFLLDVPLLRDIDDVGRVANRLYLAMNGFIPNWTGGSLFDSVDNVVFNNAGIRVLTGITYGVVTNKLPDTLVPFQTDKSTTLKVAMQVGSLVGVTQTQFLNDESVAIIGSPGTQNWEIVLFRDAVETSQNGLWDVSTLMRARRGTEVQVGNHNNGELFLVANRGVVSALLQDLSDLNVARFYRGVGFNQIPEDADTEPLTSPFNSLKPYAPVHLDAIVDGSDNIDLSWVRRTRVGGALKDGIGTVPISEDSEEYEVEILDAPAGSVVRTFTSLSTPLVEYTKANIITDLAVTTGSTTLGVADADTFSRGAGSFITDGVLVGMKVETTGFTAGANNGIFTVTVVNALTLDIEEGGLTAESGTGDEVLEAIREGDVTFKVYQISAQVGRGFQAETTITL